MNPGFFLTLAVVHFTSVITPGANFLLVAQSALRYSRSTGIFTVIGVATGTLCFSTAGIIGLAAIISQSPFLYNVIRIIGVVYFVYMGYGLITRRPKLESTSSDSDADTPQTEADISPRRAYRNGLFTALSNPAAPLYVLSLFSTFIPPETPFAAKIIAGVILVSISFIGYSLIVLTFSNPLVRSLYRRAEVWMNRAFGILWLLLALKLLVS